MRKLGATILVIGLMVWLTGCFSTIPELPPVQPAVQWELLYSDSFSSNDSFGWYQGSDGNHHWWIDGGRYHASLANTDWYWYVYNEDMTYGLTDFRLEIDTYQEGSTTDHGWGIVFRLKGESFYSFSISEDGYMGFFLFSNGVWDDSYDWEECSAIRRNGASNHIEVIALGADFTFIVNGTEVLTAHDTTLTSGSIGFMIDSYDEPNAQVAFDNLKVWIPE